MAPSRWSLRRRVLVVALALLAAVSTLVGVVAVVAVDRVLTQRLDEQLTAATVRSYAAWEASTAPWRAGIPGPAFLLVPGQAQNTLGALVGGDDVIAAAVLDTRGAPHGLSPRQQTQLAAVPADGLPHSVDLGGELGTYRIAATDVAGGYTLVTGLSLADVQATVRDLGAIVAVVVVLGLVVAGLLGHRIVRVALRPLDEVADTAVTVAGLPLDHGEVALSVRVPTAGVDPQTEVGRVGAAMNHMLGHVAAALRARQESEERVRQFVADASHELRTPLASIRGYAELTRRGPYELPDDVVHALGRVESEAVRMTGLVEQLLLLARLDSAAAVDSAPVLDREPVDLTALVEDALSDARAAGPDHVWDADLPDGPVVVSGDAARLHQAIGNLLGNARAHTPAGTRVEVVLRRTEDEGGRPLAELVVTDSGPGIPQDLLPQVFDRFVRGDSSRSRAAGSTGLGLAIVAAVVEAHGGQVEARSAPGETTFVVRLPLDADSS